MIHAIDVANFFIDLAQNEKEGSITNLKLNKLLYFAQAWALTRNGDPLFSDEIQAWDYGPVVPNVYHKFKAFGENNIKHTADDYSPDKFSDEDVQLLLDVYREYGKYSASALVEITHSESPWQICYQCGERNVQIPRSLIKDHYKGKELPTFSLPDLGEDHFIGYRNADNVLVLPAEEDDE